MKSSLVVVNIISSLRTSILLKLAFLRSSLHSLLFTLQRGFLKYLSQFFFEITSSIASNCMPERG